ncbi:MAG: hypothetical protein DWQ05_05685 [Calditrichaeota bacterium]|nr:MAG: hypothetical protein DWQ05_05685 [Calditrichota bacterium]
MFNHCIKNTPFVITLFILALHTFSNLNAGSTGIFSGRVHDLSGEQALPGATILIENTDLSGKTDKHGNFTIVGIPPGIYDVQVKHIGYATTLCTEVIIKADINTKIDFPMQLQYTVHTKFIEVQAQQLVYRGTVATTHYITSNELNQTFAADNIFDSFRYLPGVFQSHFRGGKSHDVLYLLDGLPIISGYSRAIAFNIPISAIEDVVINPGGFSSEYANGTAGVVNIIRKRGRNQFSASARSYTDYIGNSPKYRDDFRRFEASFGGPMAINFGGPDIEMNYYFGLDFLATDTPKQSEIKKVYDEGAILSNVNISALYDFSLSKNNKITFQGALSKWENHDLSDAYSLTSQALSTQKNLHLRGSVNYSYNPSRSLIFHISLSAQKLHDEIVDTNLQAPDLEPQIAAELSQNEILWDMDADEKSYRLQAGFSKQFNKYINLKAGFSADFYNLNFHSDRVFFYQDSDTVDQHVPMQSQYHRSPNVFGVYSETGFDSRHLVVKIGARIDNFNPNSSVVTQNQGEIGTLSDLSFNRYVFSPRFFLGIPFNDKNQLFFNIGEYAQLPEFSYLYHGIGASSEAAAASFPLFGNPDLTLQTATSMEAVYQKKVARNFSASFSLYSREGRNALETGFNPIFDNGQNTLRYMDSASSTSRGFEVAFANRITPNLNLQAQFTHQEIKNENNFTEENYFHYLKTGQFPENVRQKSNWSQENIFMVSGTYRWHDKMQISALTRVESPREWFRENNTFLVTRNKLDWRNFTDIKASFNLWTGKYQIGPYIEIRNLFNTRFNEFEELPFLFGPSFIHGFQDQYGRRVRLGVQIF